MKSLKFQLFMLILVLLSVLACAQDSPQNPDDFKAPLAPTITPKPANTPIPIPAATATPISDLRLGYTDRGMNCPLITEIVALALEEELAISVYRSEYETVEDLFAALASEDIDLTLCFLDPEDRKHVTGEIRPISGSYYEPNEQVTLRILANDTTIDSLRTDSCIYALFGKIKFENAQFNEQDVTKWVSKYRDQVQSWTSCDSESS